MQTQADGSVFLDLHCHTSLSDGLLSVNQLADKLYESGVNIASLTDHDTIEGLSEFHDALLKKGISFISGLEITGSHKTYMPHILAYGFDYNHPELSMVISEINLSHNPSSVIPRKYLKASDAISLIHRAGGVAILAHPFKTEPDKNALRILCSELKDLGLDGIEVFYSNNTSDEELELSGILNDFGFITSAGTDYHGNENTIPGIKMPEIYWKSFREGLFEAYANIRRESSAPGPHPPSIKKVRWPIFTFNIILPALLTFVLFVITLFSIILPYFEGVLLERKKDNIRQLTQVAIGVLQEAAEEESQGFMSSEQARSLAKERIKAMRYGDDDKDYFWIQDMEPVMLMHPYRSDLEGENLSDFVDTRGINIFVEFAELARKSGEGYISYVWHWRDDLERLEAKESYIRLFEPWGWIIGTGIYINDVQAEISVFRNQLMRISFIIVFFILLLILYLIRQGLILEKSRSRAENLLKEAMERYKSLTEAASEGTLFIHEGKFKYANPVMLEILGCNNVQLELMGIDDIFPDVEGNSVWREKLFNPEALKTQDSYSGIIERCDKTRLRCVFKLNTEPNGSGKGIFLSVQKEQDTEQDTGRKILNRLLQLPGTIASDITNAIGKARLEEDVFELCKKSPELVLSLLETGASSVAISRMLSTITDAATRRFIYFYQKEAGPSPVSFAFFCMGSQGRQSQTLYSDQDNGLIYDTDEEEDTQAIREYFLNMGIYVCNMLEKSGYRVCSGNKMARNPDWCQPLFVWKKYFKDWIKNPEEQQVVDFSIFFDFRCVEGTEEITSELRTFVNSVLKDHPHFLSQAAKNAAKFRVPMRLFGTYMNTGRIDLKAPTMAIVSFARLYALKYLLRETNTLSRLDGITRQGIMLDSKRRDIVTAYESILRLRLWTQCNSLTKNRVVDNTIDPGQLGHIEEVILRECFNEIDEMQNRIQRDFLGG